MRRVIAVVAGTLAAVVGYWCAAVVALLTMHGIPMGSAGGPPTTADGLVSLAIAAAASCGGGLLTARIAAGRYVMLAPGLLLGVMSVVGFSRPSSHWPSWFPYGMAASCAAGALLAGGRRADGGRL